MSNTLSGLTAVKVLDDRANLHEAEKYLFKQPANEVSYQSWSATSSSDSQCSFTVNPPGAEMELYSNDAAGAKVYSDPRELVCGYPPYGNTNAICLQTTEPYRYIHALGRYDLDENRRSYEMSSFPSQPDYYQRYNDRGNQSLYPVVADGVAPPNPNNAIAGTEGLNMELILCEQQGHHHLGDHRTSVPVPSHRRPIRWNGSLTG